MECIELEQDKSEQQIPKDMLNELYQSKVRGFPFFKYTGIKEYVMLGNDTLALTKIPSNPNRVTSIQIIYNKIEDGFNISYQVGKNRRNTKRVDCVFFVGDLADIIVKIMGVE